MVARLGRSRPPCGESLATIAPHQQAPLNGKFMRVRTSFRPHSLVTASLLAALSAGLLTGCPARNDLDVRWTVGGLEAADGCEDLGDTVSVEVANQDDPGAAPTRETFTAACTDGSTLVQAANNASVVVRLLRGETEIGASRPQDVELAIPEGEERPVLSTNIEVSTGRLEAVLLVAGESCADAGATEFEVTLRRQLFSVDTVDVETATVACTDGEARYINDSIRVGTRHFVYATTTAGGTTYVTDGNGVGVDPDTARTSMTVNLRDQERPPVLDAGDNNIGNPPPFDAGGAPTDSGTPPEDAGVVDSGTPVDAGGEEDAGSEIDAGPEDAGVVDAGAIDAGVADAGVTDAGAADAGAADAGNADAG